MKVLFMNSPRYAKMGWLTSEEEISQFAAALARLGVDYQYAEARTLSELDEALAASDSDTLLWANGYYIDEAEDGRAVWFAEALEERNVPFVGSGSKTLKALLSKTACQRLLKSKGVPVPSFFAVENEADATRLSELLDENDMEFPLFPKADAQAGSLGVEQASICHDLGQLQTQVKRLAGAFGYPVLVEEFLPGKDVTTAVFLTEGRYYCYPTHYEYAPLGEGPYVLDHAIRYMPWDGDKKRMRPVTDTNILAQLSAITQPVCEALGVADVTRIDSRLDKNGTLKCFDVNGMPALAFPESVIVWQVLQRFKGVRSEEASFDFLIAAIAYAAAKRQGLPMPASLASFTLEGLAEFEQPFATVPA